MSTPSRRAKPWTWRRRLAEGLGWGIILAGGIAAGVWAGGSGVFAYIVLMIIGNLIVRRLTRALVYSLFGPEPLHDDP